ncbi:MAG: sugar phosphate isomerase/epimerase [Eubacteriales bacterium]
MKLGFFAANYAHLSLEEIARIMNANGYEMMEIPAYIGNGQMDCDEILKGNNASDLVKMLKSYDIEISALSNHADSLLILGPHTEDTDLLYKGTKEEKMKYGIDSLLKTARTANSLGVPVVNGFTGVTNWGRYFPFPSANGWASMEEEFAEVFVPILDKFAEYGVKFAIEPHPNNMVYDLHTAKRAIELVGGHSSLGFNLDPANLIYLGMRVENFIDELGDRIFHVHAKDGEIVEHNIQRGGILMQGDWQRLDRAFRFRIPGWGSVPWKKIITELALVGYDYVLSYEHEDVTMSVGDGVEKVAAYLKPLIIKAPYEGRKDKIFNNPKNN